MRLAMLALVLAFGVVAAPVAAQPDSLDLIARDYVRLQLEIGAVLEPLYEAANEFGKLHAIHEVQLTKLAGVERQQMYQRLAELAEHKLFDQNKALDWWCAAIVEDPTYLSRTWITSLNFKKEPNGSKWDPSGCEVK